MADEPSPQDVKRLQSLENNIKKAQQKAKELTAERTQLKRSLAVVEKNNEKLVSREAALLEAQKELEASRNQAIQRAKETGKLASECEDENKQLSARLSEVLEENRKLAGQIDELSADLPRFRESALDAAEKIEAAQQEAASALQARNELESELKQMKPMMKRLESQVTSLTMQLKGEGKTPLLPADQVATMLDQLLGQLRGKMSGLSVGSGEVRLKVCFGMVGDHQGFVIPTPDSGPEIKDCLQEIVVRFDRKIPEI